MSGSEGPGRRVDELHRRAPEAGHPAPQRRRRAVHEPLRIGRRGRAGRQPRVRGGRHLGLLRQRERRQLLRTDADARLREPGQELPGPAHLCRRPLRSDRRASRRRGQLHTRGGLPPPRQLPSIVCLRTLQSAPAVAGGDTPVPARGELRSHPDRRYGHSGDEADPGGLFDGVRDQRPAGDDGRGQLRVPGRAVRAGTGRGPAGGRLRLPRRRGDVHSRGPAPPDRYRHGARRRVLQREHPVHRLQPRPAGAHSGAVDRADAVGETGSTRRRARSTPA